MRASIVRQLWSSVHVYLQKPETHDWFVLHWLFCEQFGFGRVSTTQAPWLQNWPVAQLASEVQPAVHTPATHNGAVVGQLAFEVHELVCVGAHTPFVQVAPAPHGFVASHPGRHCPLVQMLPDAHSLE